MPKKNLNNLVNLLGLLRERHYFYTAITPVSHQKVNQRPGNELTADLTGIFGWNRPFKMETVGAEIFEMMQAANILIQQDDNWRSQLRVSSIGELNFLHSAFPTVSNDAVFFGPDTYRFAQAIARFLAVNKLNINKSSTKRAVDIGTGSGAGAVLLAKALPACEVLALDINDEALAIASANVEAAQVTNVQVLHSDLLKNVAGDFDLIIANPPYLVDSSQRAYRHGGGLLGAGLSVAIVESAVERLSAGGSLLLYTGVAIENGRDFFHAEISNKLQTAGFHFQYDEIDPDIFGEELMSEVYQKTDRIAAVVLTAQKPA